MLRMVCSVALVLLSGCASELYVTYKSDPPGAVLYLDNHRVDYTPYTSRQTISKEDEKRGWVQIPAAKVQWISGASTEVPASKITLEKSNDVVQRSIVLQRPQGAPDLDKDQFFSLEVDRTRAAQRQAAAQEAQAQELRRQADAQERQARAEEKQAQAQREQVRLDKEKVRAAALQVYTPAVPPRNNCEYIKPDPPKGEPGRVVCK